MKFTEYISYLILEYSNLKCYICHKKVTIDNIKDFFNHDNEQKKLTNHYQNYNCQ